MNVKKIVRISLVSLLLVGIVGYIVYATVYMSNPDPKEQCEVLELTFEGGSKVQFLDRKEVENLLKEARVYPVGKPMVSVDSRAIEETIAKNAYVEKVVCYKSSKGKLCLKVDLRKPVIYILPDGQDGYFVDAAGNEIKNTHYAENLVVASGNISKAYAQKEHSQLVVFLLNDEFWNNQIEQIHVIANKGEKPKIELIPRVGDHVISLGTIDDYEDKLHRLRVFYDKAIGTVGWNKYSRISIEYNRQIICTKKKTK